MIIGDRKVRPVSPGEVIADVLEDTGMSLVEFAELTGLSLDEIHGIFANKKPIASAVSWAIGKALGVNPQLWLDLQAKVDNWDARH